jgi:hypothetical protein
LRILMLHSNRLVVLVIKEFESKPPSWEGYRVTNTDLLKFGANTRDAAAVTGIRATQYIRIVDDWARRVGEYAQLV